MRKSNRHILCQNYIVITVLIIGCFADIPLFAVVVGISDIEITPTQPTATDQIDITSSGWMGYALYTDFLYSTFEVSGSFIYLDAYFNYWGGPLPLADGWSVMEQIGFLGLGSYDVISRTWVNYSLDDTLSTTFTVVPEPCGYAVAGDLNDDCMVELKDFGLLNIDWQIAYDPNDLEDMAANWLLDCDVTPGNPACVPK